VNPLNRPGRAAGPGARPGDPRTPGRSRGRALAAAALILASTLPRAGAVSPTLVWDDEFNGPVGSAPSSVNWSYDLGVGNPVGWGNNELESYTSSTANAAIVADPNAINGKALAITAIEANGGYTSARIYTNQTFKACRLETRAMVPAGAGLWPAFWALGANIDTVSWPACGEVDVLESGGSSLQPDMMQGSLHSTNYNPTTVYINPGGTSLSAGYHVYAADCYPNEIVFSVDGVPYEDQKESAQPAGATWPFDAQFFILLNLAVGGNYPASPANTTFPQTFMVNYVRVYSLPSSPPPNLVWPPSPPSVTAYSPAAGQIQVSWQPSTGFGVSVSGYSLQRATDAAFTQNVTTVPMGTSTSYTDTSVQAGTTYYYQVVATSTNGTSDPSSPVLSTVIAPASNASLLDISSRAYVGTGSNASFGGFVIGGSVPETVLIRASGPALAAFGVTGTLPDPQLQLNRSNSDGTSTLLFTNTGWGGNSQISAAAASVGAFPWNNPSSGDSALLETLPPGAYTAVASGASGDTGVSLVEVYAVPTPQINGSNLSNISSRVLVQTGGSASFGGFVITGSTPKTVLIRASGPALAAFGVSGTLPDPQLQLNRSNSDGTSTLLETNTGWGGNSQISAAAAAVGAFPWANPASADSALLVTLPPGAYTAVTSGASGDTGVALVEVYNVN
jgi:beta-glucanase (GH16 family)